MTAASGTLPRGPTFTGGPFAPAGTWPAPQHPAAIPRSTLESEDTDTETESGGLSDELPAYAEDEWAWDQNAKDYVQQRNGTTLYYGIYQKSGAPQQPDPLNLLQSKDRPVHAPPGSADEAETRPMLTPPPPYTSAASRAPRLSPKTYLRPLEQGFQYVDKPKRFFSIGRVFQTVWFEPGGEDKTPQRSDAGWTEDCPEFHGQKAYGKYRFFVVLRKRLHHTLCFSITTAENRAGPPEARGRPKDSVVIYSSKIEPPRPAPEEGIERKPIGIILEDDKTAIAPFARLDCGRIFTVEDYLIVKKIGRVNPDSLELLEEYFKDAVL
ncbi:hypothetical protein QBC46DRAFT_14592 [Diplogelasinospora grovesii]|uniref:DUF6590 domain-containing protein n=1 Tax=Diplogelasinospora grovesii TaxID=303347 RepID=A0AAN6NFP8_9PEZI|nr:hypothetical protein QBC46DRAFT_14592 [Diplogelasinospora grovesii]